MLAPGFRLQIADTVIQNPVSAEGRNIDFGPAESPGGAPALAVAYARMLERHGVRANQR